MKAWVVADAPKRALLEAEISPPAPQPGEVLVRVRAAGVTPTELDWYPTTHTKSGQARPDAVPAHEFSGVIAALGEGVTEFSEEQEIYGLNDWFAGGALAEFCITRPEWIAPKPGKLTHAEAASVPISALTAWQALYSRARIQNRETVLIHGGAGGVGTFAIQLARARGSRVFTTVSARNLDFAKQLGADVAIDYAAENFETIARDMDVVLDTVGGETLRRSWNILKGGGRLLTIAADGESTQDARVKEAFFIVEANSSQLADIARLLDAGELRAVVDSVVPFSDAPLAYSGRVNRVGRGKMVATVGEN